jgi:hypothetical protein
LRGQFYVLDDTLRVVGYDLLRGLGLGDRIISLDQPLQFDDVHTLVIELLSGRIPSFRGSTGQVWGTTPDGRGANRRGIDRQAVADAATQRDRRRTAGSPP